MDLLSVEVMVAWQFGRIDFGIQHTIYIYIYIYIYINLRGAKGDWDFRISDLVKNPDGTNI